VGTVLLIYLIYIIVGTRHECPQGCPQGRTNPVVKNISKYTHTRNKKKIFLLKLIYFLLDFC